VEQIARKVKPTAITASCRARRLLWGLVFHSVYRFSPNFLHSWRRMLLRMFGAKIAGGAHPYPNAKIWAPWNLTMENNSCLANDVDCYCVVKVTLGCNAIVSQYSYLCAASHDYETDDFHLMSGPILIHSSVWVGADCFIGPGVEVGEGAVIGARSTVVRDVPPQAVVVGNPARIVRFRGRVGANVKESVRRGAW
jgi:putative colanic acid biosynthesis acetyltransferase WcaF